MNDHETTEKQDDVLRRMRAAASGIEPPASLDGGTLAAVAVRRVRRRRVVTAVSGGVAGVLVLAVGAFAVTGAPMDGVLPGDDDTPAVSATPRATPVAPPQGWQRAQFYGLSYAVPQGWETWSTEAELGVESQGLVEWMRVDERGRAVFTLAIDAYEPHDWGSRWDEEKSREPIAVPGASSAELVTGTGRRDATPFDWVTVQVRQEGGPWYSARFRVRVGSEPDLAQLGREFAAALTFTESADQVWAAAAAHADDLTEREVDGNTPSDWKVQEFEGLEYAIPPGMVVGDPWAEQGEKPEASPRFSWIAENGVAPGDDSYFSVAREPDGHNALIRSAGKGEETFHVDGAGRVELGVGAPVDAGNGDTALHIELQVWDEDLRRTWTSYARVPGTPEGEDMVTKFLGSLKVR